MVRIRLRRIGRKKNPVYRIVVADSKSPRDGKFIEIIGQYAPRQADQGLKVDAERALYWLGVGAQPSDTTRSLLRRAGVMKQQHENRLARKLNQAAVPLGEQSDAASPAESAVPVNEAAPVESAVPVNETAPAVQDA